jgi:hypothetical protein
VGQVVAVGDRAREGQPGQPVADADQEAVAVQADDLRLVARAGGRAEPAAHVVGHLVDVVVGQVGDQVELDGAQRVRARQGVVVGVDVDQHAVAFVADLGHVHPVQDLGGAHVQQVGRRVGVGVLQGGLAGLVTAERDGPAGHPHPAQGGRAGDRRDVADVEHERGVVGSPARSQRRGQCPVARGQQQHPALAVGHVPDRVRALPARDVRGRGQVTGGQGSGDLGGGGLHVGYLRCTG